MAKEKVNLAKQEALEQENKILKEQIARQEKLQQDIATTLGDNLSNEIKKIRQKGKSSANKITVTEQNDHTNIALWTKWGKRLGPMHPDNAIQTLNRFADIGIALSVDKPTSEQVTIWYDSPVGKTFVKKEIDRRTIKDKTRRTGQMDRLCAEIAKMTGTTVEAINKILPASEVGKK